MCYKTRTNLFLQLNASVDLGFVTARALCLPGFEAVPIDLECVIAGWGLGKKSKLY